MKKKGFTIIELIIGMAILLIVVTGVGTAVEASSSIYSKNSYDLKNVEFTNKILQYYKGLQLCGIDTIYNVNYPNLKSPPAGTKFFYLYFSNDDTSVNNSQSLNFVLSSPNPTPVTEDTTHFPNYTECSAGNGHSYKYGAIVELTKKYDNDNSETAQRYNFYTYDIKVTLYYFNNGQDVQSQLDVLVSR